MTEENWKQLDDEMADLHYRLLGWHPGRSDGLSERTYVNNDSSRCVQFVQDCEDCCSTVVGNSQK